MQNGKRLEVLHPSKWCRGESEILSLPCAILLTTSSRILRESWMKMGIFLTLLLKCLSGHSKVNDIKIEVTSDTLKHTMISCIRTYKAIS